MICPYCKEKIKKGAEKCKHCQGDFATEEGKKKLKEANKTSAFTWFIIIMVGFIIIGSIVGGEKTENIQPITSGSCDSTMKDTVANEYKSPSTVKFISCNWDQSTGIFGEADAQNKLGGTVRTTFLCNGDSCLIQEK